MVNGIGGSGSNLQSDAFAAAMRNFEAATQRLQAVQHAQSSAFESTPALNAGLPQVAAAGAPAGVQPVPKPADGLIGDLKENFGDITRQLRQVEEMPQSLLTGEVDSMHEMAARIKSADLSFRFALEVRNKLIDAYREVMRMGV